MPACIRLQARIIIYLSSHYQKQRVGVLLRTIGWTLTCGIGHVLSSVVLALGGAALGWSLSKVSWLEDVRGGIAAWVMLMFGIGYTLWGFYRLYKNNPHKHFDMDDDGLYVYEHQS